LSLLSTTEATKWAYQSVTVQPGAYYDAESWAMNASGGDTLLLRVSWYASDDGDGASIDSSDSTASVTGPAPGFRLLSTGAIRAPEAAHSARVRLLLQPAGGDPTHAFFDDVHFDRVTAPSAANHGGAVSSQTSGGTTANENGAASTDPAVLGLQSTPGGPAHVTSVPGAIVTTPPSGGGSFPWLTLMIAVPALGIGAFAAEETVRYRRRRRTPVSPED
jgi:hypothetical protein